MTNADYWARRAYKGIPGRGAVYLRRAPVCDTLVDIVTPEKRSWIMSRIRSRGTGIELRMRDILEGIGVRFEMHPRMAGNPDFANHELRIAVFCDGDFWHGYDYRRGRMPAQEHWKEKIQRNMKRDRHVAGRLRREGWSVLRFWEHDIDSDPDKCIRKIRKKIEERRAAGLPSGSRRSPASYPRSAP